MSKSSGNGVDGSLSKSSISSASSLMALQLFSRLFTFILNQALFRLASPRAFGTAAIQFELLLSTILFLSREGVRNALLRVKQTHASTRNLAFLPALIGFPLALVTSYGYVLFAGSDARTQAHFVAAIAIYALAGLTELLSEPMHNAAVAELRTGARVRAEGLGITSKTVVTFLVLLYDSKRGKRQGELALLAFAGGQLAYGVFVFLTYLAYYGTQHLWPKRPQIKDKASNYFDPEILRLSVTMTSQSVVKHFLTEGDKLILSWFSPLKDQGGYAIAVNYGSLVARIVFQPIEETSRVFFSKILAGISRASTTDTKDRRALQEAANALITLLAVQASFSVVLLVFGTAYIPIVLHVLLPQQYLATSAPAVLSAWIWYIPVLAFNGGLEAFLSSVATPEDLMQQSRWMAGFSVIYISSAVALYGLHIGDASLVYANIINLSVRIAYAVHFISSFYANNHARDVLRWRNAIPSWHILVVAALSAASIWFSEQQTNAVEIVQGSGKRALVRTPVMTHIALGLVCALACAITWWMTSGRHLSIFRRTKLE